MKLIYWSCVRNVSVAGEMLEASSLVACARTIIAVPLMARMLADLPPKLGRRGNHRASRSGTSVELAQRMAHSGRPSRRPRAEHSKLAALFALVVLSVTPASADDLIEQWLKKEEASAQTVEARPDLNALTDEQWNETFKLGREQAEPVEYARETPTRSLPLWLAALVVACGIVIGGVKVRSFMRSHL